MGDVRDILAGATRGTNAETTAAGRAAFAEKMALQKKQKKKRPKGMSREVFALLGDGALARDDLLRGVAKNESIAQFRAELRGGKASTILAGLLDAPDQLKHALPKAVDNTTWAAAVSAAATRAATASRPAGRRPPDHFARANPASV